MIVLCVGFVVVFVVYFCGSGGVRGGVFVVVDHHLFVVVFGFYSSFDLLTSDVLYLNVIV